MTHPFGLSPTVPIVQLGHPVLRAPAPAWRGDIAAEDLSGLISIMRDTMLAAPGVGLAAPQIGLPLRLAVLQDLWPVDPASAEQREREPLEFFAAIDPSYEALGHRTASHYEGCLSFRGYTAVVERPADILAGWSSPDGERHERELHGWQARIFQHETDHLNGILYIDKALTRSLCTDEHHAALYAGAPLDEVRSVLGF